MRRILPPALGLVLLTFGPIYGDQTATPPPQPTGTAAISGVVTDAVTGRPIAGASMFLSGAIRAPDGRALSPIQRPQLLTDARGRFVFVDLPATHQYTVFASRSGYSVGEYEVPIRLAEGEWMREANIKMWRSSSIGGRVFDERGEPIVGASVRLFRRRMAAGHELLVQGPLATTDDRGIYRVPYLDPDRYFVAVLSVQATVPASVPDGARQLPLGGLIGRGRSAPPASRAEAQGASIDVDGRHRLVLTNFATPPPPGVGRSRAYAPVFHPNARTVAEAQAIELERGTSRNDVDFQLAPVDTIRITGRVTGAVQDAANMILRLMPRGGEQLGSGSEVATALVESDLTFAFLNVPIGDYTLVASPAMTDTSSGSSPGSLPSAPGSGPKQGYSAGYPSGVGFFAMWWRFRAGASGWSQIPIAAGNADVTGVEVPLQPMTAVRGRVVLDDPAQADPNLRFTVMLEPANGDLMLGMPFTTTAMGDTTFAFNLTGLQSGRYLFRLSRFGGWQVKSVSVRGVDVIDTGIDGTAGRDYDDVIVTASKTGAELSGFVRDGSGRPATGAVVLFPADPKWWVDYGLTPDRLQSITTGRDGSFKLMAFRDGEYYVIAVPHSQSNAWTDPRFLAASAPKATRISLKAGVASAQNLQVSEVIVK